LFLPLSQIAEDCKRETAAALENGRANQSAVENFAGILSEAEFQARERLAFIRRQAHDWLDTALNLLQSQLLSHFECSLAASHQPLARLQILCAGQLEHLVQLLHSLESPATCIETIIDFIQFEEERREDWRVAFEEVDGLLGQVENRGVPYLETPGDLRETILELVRGEEGGRRRG
jgi:hypothetical protein